MLCFRSEEPGEFHIDISKIATDHIAGDKAGAFQGAAFEGNVPKGATVEQAAQHTRAKQVEVHETTLLKITETKIVSGIGLAPRAVKFRVVKIAVRETASHQIAALKGDSAELRTCKRHVFKAAGAVDDMGKLALLHAELAVRFA